MVHKNNVNTWEMPDVKEYIIFLKLVYCILERADDHLEEETGADILRFHGIKNTCSYL